MKAESEVVVGDVKFTQLESGDLVVSLPRICNPEDSIDQEAWAKLLAMTEKLQTAGGTISLSCDPQEIPKIGEEMEGEIARSN